MVMTHMTTPYQGLSGAGGERRWDTGNEVVYFIAILLYSISEWVADHEFWCKATFRFDLGWILYNSVILLWDDEKRHYFNICKFLQSGSVQYVLNVLFTFSIIKRRFFCMLRNTRSKLILIIIIPLEVTTKFKMFIFRYVSQSVNKLKKYF
jgi:hypothetical protein